MSFILKNIFWCHHSFTMTPIFVEMTADNKYYLQIIIHNWYVQADLIHILRRDVKDDRLIICRIQSILFYGRFLFFQAPFVADEWHLHVRICQQKRWVRHEFVKLFLFLVCSGLNSLKNVLVMALLTMKNVSF